MRKNAFHFQNVSFCPLPSEYNLLMKLEHYTFSWRTHKLHEKYGISYTYTDIKHWIYYCRHDQ